MKKLLIAAVLCLVVVSLMVTPAMAAQPDTSPKGAVKVDICIFNGNNKALGDVVGFAVLNSDGNGGLNVQVVVKDMEEGSYIVVVQAPTADGLREAEGTLTVNKNGNGNVHLQVDDMENPCRVNIRDAGDTEILASTANSGAGTVIPEK